MSNYSLHGTATLPVTLAGGGTAFIGANGSLYVFDDDAMTVTGSSRIAVLGSVVAGEDPGDIVYGIRNFAPSNTQAITIGAQGTVGALVGGAINMNTLVSFNLTNAGMVFGSTVGVNAFAGDAAADMTVQNTGEIFASAGAALLLDADGGVVKITNAGLISSGGTAAIGLTGAFTSIINSGTIEVTNPNTGAVRNAVSTGSGADRVENTGLILGNVLTGSGVDRFINTGAVIGDITLGDGNDRFDSRGGTITGSVSGGLGADSYFLDCRDIVINELAGGTDIDVIYATCSLLMADNVEQLFLRGGQDLSGTGNDSANRIYGGAGDDTLKGVGGADSLTGGDGQNLLAGGTGDDTLAGGQDDDRLSGGLGADTVQFLTTQLGVNVNLDTGTAFGAEIGDDVLDSIENVSGTAFVDRLTGNAVANAVSGGSGDDRILGAGGNDTLTGGQGADSLAGGTGADRFAYRIEADSTAAAFDLIADFAQGEDRISLDGIDAVAATVGNDAFVFSGTTPLGTTAGQLRYFQDTLRGVTVIEASLDTDTAAEMRIELNGLFTLMAVDFDL